VLGKSGGGERGDGAAQVAGERWGLWFQYGKGVLGTRTSASPRGSDLHVKRKRDCCSLREDRKVGTFCQIVGVEPKGPSKQQRGRAGSSKLMGEETGPTS